MYLINLTQIEHDLLRDYATKSPVEKIRAQAQTILWRDKRVEIADIADITGRSTWTITNWLKKFCELRIGSIFSGSIDNQNAAKLTTRQREEIKRVVSQPPNKHGIPWEFWTPPKLKTYVKTIFGVEYESDRSYHFLLKFCNLSFKYPDQRSPLANQKEIDWRMREIKQEIKPHLKDPNTLVFAADEVRVQLEAEIRKCWLVKGKKTIIHTQRSHEHQNYLGFLNLNSHRVDLFEIDYGNSEQIILALEKLVQKYSDKNIVIVWDNARWHKSKLLREKLTKNNSLSKLHLINFPPYAPEHNPIEHVWNTAKKHISNKTLLPFDVIKQQFISYISKHIFPYQI